MRKISRRAKSLFSIFFMLAVLVGGSAFYATTQPASNAFAGASVEGAVEGANNRLLITSDDRVRRVVYFKMEPHATGGANTPVPSAKVCGLAGNMHYAEVQLTGTLTGSAPTLAIKWQNSLDNGTTWTDVHTFTTINATVTPATQKKTLTDILAGVDLNDTNTPVTTDPVMYGDCWRVTYTMGAGGAGTFAIIGAEK